MYNTQLELDLVEYLRNIRNPDNRAKYSLLHYAKSDWQMVTIKNRLRRARWDRCSMCRYPITAGSIATRAEWPMPGKVFLTLHRSCLYTFTLTWVSAEESDFAGRQHLNRILGSLKNPYNHDSTEFDVLGLTLSVPQVPQEGATPHLNAQAPVFHPNSNSHQHCSFSQKSQASEETAITHIVPIQQEITLQQETAVQQEITEDHPVQQKFDPLLDCGIQSPPNTEPLTSGIESIWQDEAPILSTSATSSSLAATTQNTPGGGQESRFKDFFAQNNQK